MMQLNQDSSVPPGPFFIRAFGARIIFFLLTLTAFWPRPLYSQVARTQIVSTTLPDQNSLTASVIDQFTISASSNVSSSAGTNSANFGLRAAGANQILGDGDDIVYPLSASVVGTNVSFTFPNAPLQPGRYRFETRLGFQDSTGAPIQLFAREFALAQPPGGRIEST